MSTASIEQNTNDLADVRAAIIGLDGTDLTSEERSLFSDAAPYGFILFARNIDTPEQVRSLTDSLREVTGRSSLPILIDQEGGRVARLKPPYWPALPAVGRLVDDWTESQNNLEEALRRHAETIGSMLFKLGITVNCAPMIDVRDPDSHDGVIGDRAFSDDSHMVTHFGRLYAQALRASGVLPVIKHVPGHGRAKLDSHTHLPYVDAPFDTLAQTDFVPFKALSSEAMVMSAHVVFSQIDPVHPATTSAQVIDTVIRQYMGISGLLLSDDLTMQALTGSPAERTKACLTAGCDVALYCNGSFEDRKAALLAAPDLSGPSLARAQRVTEDITHLTAGAFDGNR